MNSAVAVKHIALAASAIIFTTYGAIGALRRRIMIGRGFNGSIYLEGRAALVCGLTVIAIGISAGVNFFSN